MIICDGCCDTILGFPLLLKPFTGFYYIFWAAVCNPICIRTFFYSIELRKCGVCRQRKSSGARRKTECSWWPCMKNWFSSWNSMLPWGQGWAFLPWNKPKACWRAKMPTPARRAAYCWVRKTSAECRATKYWRYFSIAKELSLSKYTSFPWFYWIRDFVTLQNTVFLIAKSGKEIKILSPCYARRKRKKLGTHKQLQEGKRCCKVTKSFFTNHRFSVRVAIFFIPTTILCFL